MLIIRIGVRFALVGLLALILASTLATWAAANTVAPSNAGEIIRPITTSDLQP